MARFIWTKEMTEKLCQDCADSMSRKLQWHFGLGALGMAGLIMAIQDWLGLEAYIQYCREHWINYPWWAGGTIFLLCTVYAGIRASRERASTIRAGKEVFKNYEELQN